MRSRVGGEKRAAVGVPADHQVEPRLGVFRVSEKFEDEIFGRKRSFGKIVLIPRAAEASLRLKIPRQAKISTAKDTERSGKLLWRKIAGTQGRSGIPAAFLNFPKADFRESDKNVASPLIENPRDLTEGEILLFMRIRRRFPLGIFNRGYCGQKKFPFHKTRTTNQGCL